MRGKVYSFGNIKDQVGITPAYAGKSITEIFQKDVNKDHPRLCGEKGYFKMIWNNIKGSPPPMRGKDFSRLSLTNVPRITPAYAGKSFQHVSSFIACRDHPRLCGEKLLTLSRGAFQPRITPAYAGKSH